jgi:hypothetical protein
MQEAFRYLNITGSFQLASSSNFYLLEQQYEHNIILSNYDHSRIEELLRGDLCLRPSILSALPADLQLYCARNSNADNSLANNLNFVESFLRGSANESAAKWVRVGTPSLTQSPSSTNSSNRCSISPSPK